MSLATRITELATRVATEFNSLRSSLDGVETVCRLSWNGSAYVIDTPAGATDKTLYDRRVYTGPTDPATLFTVTAQDTWVSTA